MTHSSTTSSTGGLLDRIHEELWRMDLIETLFEQAEDAGKFADAEGESLSQRFAAAITQQKQLLRTLENNHKFFDEVFESLHCSLRDSVIQCPGVDAGHVTLKSSDNCQASIQVPLSESTCEADELPVENEASVSHPEVAPDSQFTHVRNPPEGHGDDSAVPDADIAATLLLALSSVSSRDEALVVRDRIQAAIKAQRLTDQEVDLLRANYSGVLDRFPAKTNPTKKQKAK